MEDVFYLCGNYSDGIVLIHAVKNDPLAVSSLHRLLLSHSIILDTGTTVVIYSDQILTVSRHTTNNIGVLTKLEAIEISKVMTQSPSITIAYKSGAIRCYNSEWQPIEKYSLNKILLINYVYISSPSTLDEITPQLESMSLYDISGSGISHSLAPKLEKAFAEYVN